MSKLDKNLNLASGFISQALGLFGMYAVIFLRSEVVTAPFVGIGIIGFCILFMYGLQKAMTSGQS